MTGDVASSCPAAQLGGLPSQGAIAAAPAASEAQNLKPSMAMQPKGVLLLCAAAAAAAMLQARTRLLLRLLLLLAMQSCPAEDVLQL